MKILRLKPNLKGRTFVTTDIHGSFSCVQRFLKEIEFSKTKDRLICAGDLVDRGPENEKCLELLFKKWFFSVMGNHEEMMYDYFTGGPYGMYWDQNGGRWAAHYKKLPDSDKSKAFINSCVKKLRKLPHLITVEKKNGELYHVLHAELPTYNALSDKVKITDKLLADKKQFKKIATISTQDGDSVVWGRYIFGYLGKQVIDDRILKKFKSYVEINKIGKIFNSELSHIYSGHTILKQPTTFLGQTNLDTNAYGSYLTHSSPYGHVGTPREECGLTVTEPETGKFYFCNDREFKETTPLKIC